MENFQECNIRLENSDEKGIVEADAMIYYLQKAKNSICEIQLKDGFGTGFFCKIPYTDDNNHFIACLITCNHVLSKDLIKENNINIIIDGQTKTIPLNQRRIWTDEIIDFTCIEIKENEDNIDNYFYLDDNVFKKNCSNECYLNQKVFIYGINKIKHEKKLAFSNGIIKSTKNSFFSYNCNTFPGCSGGCIVNQFNNCVIGIHKGKKETGNKNVVNVGIFIRDVIKFIKRKEKKKKESKTAIDYIVN